MKHATFSHGFDLRSKSGAVRGALRSAQRETIPGVHTFYVAGETPGAIYTVQHIRRPSRCGLHCTCPDFTHRRLPLGRLCKHARFVARMARRFHGITRLAAFILKGCAA